MLNDDTTPGGNGNRDGDATEPRLIGLQGPLSGYVFPCRDRALTIGRDEANTVNLEDRSVSRQHCQVEASGAGFVVTDAESRHGTFVNGTRVKSQTLVSGDRIAVGRSVFVFRTGPHTPSESTLSFELSDQPSASGDTRRLRVDESRFFRPDRVFSEPSARANADLGALQSLGAAFQQASSVSELAARLLTIVGRMTPAERGGVLLLAEGPGLTFGETHTWSRSPAVRGTVQLSRTVAHEVVTKRVAVLSSDVRLLAQFGEAKSLVQSSVAAVLCVPIHLFDNVLGVLYLDTSDKDVRFDADHLELATAMAALAAMPLYVAQHGTQPVDSVSEVPRLRPVQSAALVSRALGPLHLGEILRLRTAFDLLPLSDRAIVLLFADFTNPPTQVAIRPEWLDRIALLPEAQLIARTSAVAAIPRLATMVAATLPPSADSPADPRGWLETMLLAAGIVTTGASHVITEPTLTVNDRVAADADLELARKLVTRLNQHGQTLPRPAPMLPGCGQFLSLDGRGPMGDSERGTVLLADSTDQTARKIRRATTDPKPVLDPDAGLSYEVRNLLLLLHAVTGEPMGAALNSLAGLGYGVLKERLVEAVNAYLEPLRQRRDDLARDTTLAGRIERDSRRLDLVGMSIAQRLGSPA